MPTINLYYSVLIYLIPAFYASHHGLWLGPALYTLIPIAVLNHAKHHEPYQGKRLVKYVDRFFSHMIAFKTLVDSIGTWQTLNMHIFWATWTYTTLAFYILKPLAQTRKSAQFVHATMHLFSAIGLLSYIAENLSPKN